VQLFMLVSVDFVSAAGPEHDYEKGRFVQLKHLDHFLHGLDFAHCRLLCWGPRDSGLEIFL
jgi:hypothetical protein